MRRTRTKCKNCVSRFSWKEQEARKVFRNQSWKVVRALHYICVLNFKSLEPNIEKNMRRKKRKLMAPGRPVGHPLMKFWHERVNAKWLTSLCCRYFWSNLCSWCGAVQQHVDAWRAPTSEPCLWSQHYAGPTSWVLCIYYFSLLHLFLSSKNMRHWFNALQFNALQKWLFADTAEHGQISIERIMMRI